MVRHEGWFAGHEGQLAGFVVRQEADLVCGPDKKVVLLYFLFLSVSGVRCLFSSEFFSSSFWWWSGCLYITSPSNSRWYMRDQLEFESEVMVGATVKMILGLVRI